MKICALTHVHVFSRVFLISYLAGTSKTWIKNITRRDFVCFTLKGGRVRSEYLENRFLFPLDTLCCMQSMH